jgi:N-acetylmuramic acid 6-phosphate etherase
MTTLRKETFMTANSALHKSSTTQELLQQLDHLVSEGRNPNTMNLDQLSTPDLLKVINKEDQKVAFAIEEALPDIAKAVDMAVNSIQHGGRMIFMGAGTSGRLGVLDAVECRPTFSVSDKLVVGLIAGGECFNSCCRGCRRQQNCRANGP